MTRVDRLPLVASVPHAGRVVPPEAAPYCILDDADIAADGDGQAREVYALHEDMEVFLTTDIARAIVDLNRPPDDRWRDGVVKTHTCWNVPVYERPLPEDLVELLLARYHRPYHRRLSAAAEEGLLAGVDLHTMAPVAPPVAPDPGRPRPAVCLSDGDGTTLPRGWMEALAAAFRAQGVEPSVNRPFRGGHITRSHGAEMPWVQIELSRGGFLGVEAKRELVKNALRRWCASLRPEAGRTGPRAAWRPPRTRR